jgi:hypothetical protein
MSVTTYACILYVQPERLVESESLHPVDLEGSTIPPSPASFHRSKSVVRWHKFVTLRQAQIAKVKVCAFRPPTQCPEAFGVCARHACLDSSTHTKKTMFQPHSLIDSLKNAQHACAPV